MPTRFKVDQPIRCHLIAFLLVIRYATLWPWPLTMWLWSLSFDLDLVYRRWLDETLYQICVKSSNLWPSVPTLYKIWAKLNNPRVNWGGGLNWTKYEENWAPLSLHPKMRHVGTDIWLSFERRTARSRVLSKIEAKVHTFWLRVKIRGGMGRMLSGRLEFTPGWTLVHIW